MKKRKKFVKKSKNPSAILKQKENRLDWNTFNFLENLLIFCTISAGRKVFTSTLFIRKQMIMRFCSPKTKGL